MRLRKLNKKLFIINFLICLAVFIAAAALYWTSVRSSRYTSAEKAAALEAKYIQGRINNMGKYADVPAAWLDVEGDDVKKAIADSEDGEEYRSEFERLAKSLYDEEDMYSVQLVPDGVVKYVYPAQENEILLGTDLREKEGEALERAEQSEDVVIIGPEFVSKIGLGLSFYMPVRYENGDFWGYTAIMMRLPDALQEIALDRLEEQGYDYELRYVTDAKSDKTERITGTLTSSRNTAQTEFDIQGTEWILSVRPKEGWISTGSVALTILIALAAALLLSWIAAMRQTHREEAMKQLQSDARHDKMTGLLNHTASAEAIDNALKTVEGGVLLLIDIDNFKTINDSAGHLSGDEVLVEVANAMRTTFRKHDILGRYGGDEFIVYMVGDISIPEFSVKASQFQRKIRKIPIGKTGKYVTCSIGGARRCVETPTAETLVHRADQAMYTSKGNGKDRFTIFDDSGSTLVVTQKKDESEFKHDYTISE